MANIGVSGVLWRRLSAAAYGCAFLLLVTFALDELAAPKRTYQAMELVRNRMTPAPFSRLNSK